MRIRLRGSFMGVAKAEQGFADTVALASDLDIGHPPEHSMLIVAMSCALGVQWVA